MNREVDKADVVCIYNGILLIKEELHFAICSNMVELSGIMPSEVRERNTT